MAELIKQLYKKGDDTTLIFPNIKGDNIPSNAVTSDNIADSAITENKINNGAITQNKIADGSVSTAKISDNAITNAKITMGSITNDKIVDGAVTTSKIENSAVTNIKLSDNAVTTAKILNNAITNSKIAPNSISYNQLTFNLYYYTGTIEKSGNFYITFEMYSITNMDVNYATKEELLSLLFENRQDAFIYVCGYDIVHSEGKVFELHMTHENDEYKLYVNGNDETSSIDIVDVIKTPIFN